MIEKFISIKNIGKFRDCISRGDVTFRKLTLIFAENGRGKTTLCAILRSLKTGQPEYISERKTLGTDGSAAVQMRVAGRNFAFTNDAWPSTLPDIAIFDSAFIHDNVYAGDYVDHEHKKNLYHVIVGEQGVRLSRQIEDLDTQIRDANTKIKTAKDSVSRMLPNGTPLETYIAWMPIQDIETRIQQKNAEITNRQRILHKATEIRTKGLLAKIQLPSLPSDFLTVLSKQLDDIAANAEDRVRGQVQAHRMGHHGEIWLSQGFAFIAGDKCPFCGQAIGGNALIAAYRSHFSDAYNELKKEVAQLSQRVTNAIGDASLNDAQQSVSNNLTLIEFWRQFGEVAVNAIDFADVRVKYSDLHNSAVALAQRKQQTPTEPVQSGIDFEAALGAVKGLQESVEGYNAAVDAANKLIVEQKSGVQHGTDINVLKGDLKDLEAKRKRFTSDAVKACQEYKNALAAKTGFEQQKANAKEQLDQHCHQILQAYQASINSYLDQFSAGFRITNSRHLYTGGSPSSFYQIEINNTAVDLGDARTQPGTPCFKSTLSSGDRSALALAFFLAAIMQDASIGNKIVVLYDPFTSQDRFRRTCTQQLIRQLAGKAEQVVLLSHDPSFLDLVWRGYPDTDIKVLQLRRDANTTTIGEWDIEVETRSTYMMNYHALLQYYRDVKGTPLDVARSIRPFLEGLLRARFPGHFQPDEWLGDMTHKIRSATDTDGLQHAKADLTELEAIKDYSKKYHHDQNRNADSEPLSVDELHGFVKRTLRMVGAE